jgi:hypothetical protein
MNCGRCGDSAEGGQPLTLGTHPMHLCPICTDLLWNWLGLVPPLPKEPTLPPQPPVSLYYED